MDDLRPLMEKQGWQSLNTHGYYTLGGGVPAHREDFRTSDAPPRYAAVLAGPLRGYEVKVVVLAGSPDRVDELVKAALTMKIQPNWSVPDANNASSSNLHDPTGSAPKRVCVSASILQSLAKKNDPPIVPV